MKLSSIANVYFFWNYNLLYIRLRKHGKGRQNKNQGKKQLFQILPPFWEDEYLKPEAKKSESLRTASSSVEMGNDLAP